MAEEQNKLMDKVGAAVEKIAKERGYDLVINGMGTVMYAKDTVDISKDVIALVSKSN